MKFDSWVSGRVHGSFWPLRPWYTSSPSMSSTSRTVIFQFSKWVMTSPGEKRTRVSGALRSAYWRVSPVAG
ncbi:hypothetical protein D3C85_1685390 [compost metagenome]